jgi:hypothetical protein
MIQEQDSFSNKIFVRILVFWFRTLLKCVSAKAVLDGRDLPSSTGRMLHKIIKEGKKKGRDMYSRFNVFELNRFVLLLIQICLESFLVAGISMMDVFQ